MNKEFKETAATTTPHAIYGNFMAYSHLLLY